MKKIALGFTLLLGVFFLSGCSMFGEEGIEGVWYDEQEQVLHLSYDLARPEKDEETGESIREYYFLMAKADVNEEWYEVVQLDNYRADDLQLDIVFQYYGNIELMLEKRDAENNVIESSEAFFIYINEPQFIYHFDVWFDSWSGGVQFNFGVDESKVLKVSFEKSIDGGISWEEVMVVDIEVDSDGFMKNQVVYYEYEEGNYVYKIIAFDDQEEIISEMTTWGETNVKYNDQNFDGEAMIDNVGSSLNIYESSVNIWWNAQGDFDETLIEKSADGETWEIVGTVPRFVHTYNFSEDTEGNYFYKVTALKDEVSVSSMETTEQLRVKDGILIGHFDGWVDWESNSINLNWDFMNEENITVVIERSYNDSEFEVVEEFGGLKKMFTDNNLLPGQYVYRISLMNDLDETLDTLESKMYTIEEPQHVYHVNAWFNQSTGEIEFNFGLNQNIVKTFTIEKSSDGGLTWSSYVEKEVEMNSDNYFKDNFRVYELVEGTYAYKIIGYDELGNFAGEAYSYNEVIVEYYNLNLEEPTEIYHLDGNFNIYDNTINLWWNAQGGFTHYTIEYSSDEVTWNLLLDVPRVATFTQISDLEDGEYFFRINAVDEDNNVVTSHMTNQKLRVKEDALIGSFNGHYDYSQQRVNLSWDIIKDQIALIRVERRLADDDVFGLVGEFGPLKTTLFDSPLETESYVYRLTLLNSDGTVLDQME